MRGGTQTYELLATVRTLVLTAQGGAGPAKSKIIERVLTAVLTPGTLMGDFVVEENATYIMSIKVCIQDFNTA